MRHENKSDAEATLQQLEFNLHFFAQFAVESTKWLVEQQHAGAIDESSGNGNTLLLTTRHLPGLTLGQFTHLHHVEGFGNFCRNLRLRNSLLTQPVCHIFGNGHVWKQCVVLKDGVDVTLVRRNTLYVFAAYTDKPRVGLFKTGKHSQGCGLATSAWAEQRQELTGLHQQID